MAKSRYEYVKKFEVLEPQLPHTYMVIRLDGRSFHQFTQLHDYQKPNDERGLGLMGKCAWKCMEEFPECCFAYGQSDEFSFVMSPDAKVFSRRKDKILTTFVSLFSSSFVFYWKEFFGDHVLQYAPVFDGRIVLYPTFRILRDYLSWRQVDCHINNLYNTTFWTLVQQGNLTGTEAEEKLRGSTSEDKNELLFSEFGINYNNEPMQFKKGSILYRPLVDVENVDRRTGKIHTKKKRKLVLTHEDIISNQFWEEHPEAIMDNSKQ